MRFGSRRCAYLSADSCTDLMSILKRCRRLSCWKPLTKPRGGRIGAIRPISIGARGSTGLILTTNLYYKLITDYYITLVIVFKEGKKNNIMSKFWFRNIYNNIFEKRRDNWYFFFYSFFFTLSMKVIKKCNT